MRKITVAARAPQTKSWVEVCGLYKQVTHSVGFPIPPTIKIRLTN